MNSEHQGLSSLSDSEREKFKIDGLSPHELLLVRSGLKAVRIMATFGVRDFIDLMLEYRFPLPPGVDE